MPGRIVMRIFVGYIGLTKGARRLVGGKKRRFIGEGFDLDLTYIGIDTFDSRQFVSHLSIFRTTGHRDGLAVSKI